MRRRYEFRLSFNLPWTHCSKANLVKSIAFLRNTNNKDAEEVITASVGERVIITERGRLYFRLAPRV